MVFLKINKVWFCILPLRILISQMYLNRIHSSYSNLIHFSNSNPSNLSLIFKIRNVTYQTRYSPCKINITSILLNSLHWVHILTPNCKIVLVILIPNLVLNIKTCSLSFSNSNYSNSKKIIIITCRLCKLMPLNFRHKIHSFSHSYKLFLIKVFLTHDAHSFHILYIFEAYL